MKTTKVINCDPEITLSVDLSRRFYHGKPTWGIGLGRYWSPYGTYEQAAVAAKRQLIRWLDEPASCPIPAVKIDKFPEKKITAISLAPFIAAVLGIIVGLILGMLH